MLENDTLYTIIGITMTLNFTINTVDTTSTRSEVQTPTGDTSTRLSGVQSNTIYTLGSLLRCTFPKASVIYQ